MRSAPRRRITRGRRLHAVGLCALLLALGSPVRADDDAAVRAAVERVYAERNIQGDLPDSRPDDDQSPSATPSPAPTGGGRSAPPARPPAQVGVPPWLSWGALGVGVLCVVAWLVATWLESRRRSTSMAAPTPAPSTTVAAAQPIPVSPLDRVRAAACDMAANGQADEAAHALLLDAVARALRDAHRAGEIALTSREVVAATRLTEVRQTGLAALVRLVERSRFAGIALGAAEFHEALDAHAAAAGAAA